MSVLMVVVFALAGVVLVGFYPVAAGVSFFVAVVLIGISGVRFFRQRRRAQSWTASGRARVGRYGGGAALGSYVNGGCGGGGSDGGGDGGGGGGCGGGGE
ncbi:hypothetical protein ACFQZZ_01965 [Nocardia sp. GCM10030253]|uniref:hypothetical protein n=1 Tax=Nocardia sp. GCM10030253 TaxID=3273404 RepID=UPI00363D4B33